VIGPDTPCTAVIGTVEAYNAFMLNTKYQGMRLSNKE
jgi:hypothetical protein